MKKEGWPAFPFFWESSTSKWNMSALRDLASHLEQKTAAPRQRSSLGYRGDASEMEKQIFQHISDLEQQVFELEDALQALLQIIDDNRPSQRLRRSWQWIRTKAAALWLKIEQNTLYRIIAGLGVLGTLYFIIKLVLVRFHILK